MKQLTCEMCGSTDLLKQDGVFVCQTCGTKYSLEEAKKMMIEGTVNVSGTVKVDNTEQLDNYLSMARSAYDSDNYSEAENYCNKIIEICPEHSQAWLLKGMAAAWQSTLANIRLVEAMNCFTKAINYATEEKQEMTTIIMGQEMTVKINPKVNCRKRALDCCIEVAYALLNLEGDNFISWPDKENVDRIKNLFEYLKKQMVNFIGGTGPTDTINVIEYLVRPTKLFQIAKIAWEKTVLAEYKSERFPDDRDFDKLLERADRCCDLAIYGCYDVVKKTVQEYEEGIANCEYCKNILTTAMNSCSWDWDRIDYKRDMPGGEASVIARIKQSGGVPDPANDRYYHVKLRVSEKGKESYKKQIKMFDETEQEYKAALAEIKNAEEKKKKEEQKKKNDAYWAEHSEEKKNLENEREQLKSELKQLQTNVSEFEKQINATKAQPMGKVASEKEKDTVLSEISRLRKEQGELGFFKGKQKKALQAQIDELNSRISTLNDSIEKEKKEQQRAFNSRIADVEAQAKPVKDRLATVQNRINEINKELTKDRLASEINRNNTNNNKLTSGGDVTAKDNTGFDVILASFGDNKMPVIKAVKETFGLSLKETKELVEAAPKVLKKGVSKAEAEKIKAKLEEAGATIEIK